MTALTLRALGGALLVISGALLGRERRRALERRAEVLRALSAALGRMAGELETLESPLGELFAHLSDEPFFRFVSAGFGAEPLEPLWRRAAAAQPIPAPEQSALADLGSVLGRCAAQRQCVELALVRRRLTDAADALEHELSVRGRRYDGLGAALGAIIAVLLF